MTCWYSLAVAMLSFEATQTLRTQSHSAPMLALSRALTLYFLKVEFKLTLTTNVKIASLCRRAAAALGYAAVMVDRLSVVLDVPLRYPLLLAGSTSAVLEHPAPLARRR